MNYHNVRRSDELEFVTKLERVIKCTDCGKSWLIKKN